MKRRRGCWCNANLTLNSWLKIVKLVLSSRISLSFGPVFTFPNHPGCCETPNYSTTSLTLLKSNLYGFELLSKIYQIFTYWKLWSRYLSKVIFGKEKAIKEKRSVEYGLILGEFCDNKGGQIPLTSNVRSLFRTHSKLVVLNVSLIIIF